MALEMDDSTSPRYEIRLFAFIDILGWKDLIKRSVNDQNILRDVNFGHKELSRLTGNLREQKSYFTQRGQPQYGPAVESTQFSDTVVVSCPVSRQAYYGFLLHIYATCSKLLEAGFYTRGGVTAGFVYHNDNAVFGPALITAYELEQHVAIYPRIVVDDLAMAFLKEQDDIIQSERDFLKQDLYQVDTDGVSYLNVMTPPIMLWSSLDTQRSKLQRCLSLVDSKCEKDFENIRRMMKHRWMQGYLRKLLETLPSFPDPR